MKLGLLETASPDNLQVKTEKKFDKTEGTKPEQISSC